jgi:glycosyltransferase involved in cell wall biosynthesis
MPSSLTRSASPRLPRVLHAPADVGGNAYGLSRAERELGLHSDVAVFAPGPLGYGFDIDLRAGVDRPVWLRLVRRAKFLRRAVSDYDVFHFNFGLTLMTVRQLGFVRDELAFLKRRGKTVLVTYQGCDVRPKACCPCRKPGCFAEDRYRQPAARRALEHADRVFYLNPDLRQWLPGARFLPYASVDPREVEPVPAPEGEELVVAHAPTDRDVKGTAHVIEAVEALRQEGVPIRLDLIEGVTRTEVLERLRAAGIVVDQILMGWYGAFAVEAMALGRPVLSHVREEEPEDNPFGARLPIVRTSAATLVDDLRALVLDREQRGQLARAGRIFVEEHHDPRRIARAALEGLVPISAEPPTSGPERTLSARAPS